MFESDVLANDEDNALNTMKLMYGNGCALDADNKTLLIDDAGMR